MKQSRYLLMLSTLLFISAMACHALAFSFGNNKPTQLKPDNQVLTIPVADISDGKAHYFQVMADDGILVSFFTVKSSDGIIRAAIDACDVCYRAGKGYVQEGDVMKCLNCGMKFPTNRINVVKGGCNPAPLARSIQEDRLVIRMADINANSWYCKFKQ